ncbi:hypothetical protein D9M72_472310 [compost metagenome]
MLAHDAGDRDAAGIGERLQARRDVDPVTIDVLAIGDDIAEIDTDAINKTAVLGLLRFGYGHFALDFDRATDCIGDACEFHQHPIAHQLDDPTAVRGNTGVDHIMP